MNALLVVALLVVAILYGILRPAKAHCAGCASSGHEVSRLAALNVSLMRQLGEWITKADLLKQRADIAERRVEELWMEHHETKAKQNVSWEIISQRTKAIDEAKAKCGPEFTHIVGTAMDPVFLNRLNAAHDDIAWVATVEELTRGTQ